MELRKWILTIHFYGGLLCFWYLIIFAVSSLHFHHHFGFMNGGSSTEESEQKLIALENSGDDSALAANIQNALNISGNYHPWKTARDNRGIFYTEIENPKIKYHIKYEPSLSTVTITKKDKGFWSVFNALHGLSENIPNAPLLVFWKICTYVCLITVVFSIFSGIWLWAKREKDKLTGWVTVFGIIALSLSLMINLYLNG